VHDTFHAFMLSELDRYGATTPDFFEQINLRLAQSVTARNALGREPNDGVREIATMLYGEIHPSGHFRFVNFGHPPPLIFCSKSQNFRPIDKDRMAQFPPLGLEIPEDHPDRNKYLSMTFRKKQMNSSDVEELTLMDRGDILFLYSDGAYDGSDRQSRLQIEQVMRDHKDEPAKEICNAVLEYAVKQDDYLEQINEADRIDDKTVFIIKRT
jgi:Stage II sporulation protein E (SpoIIE)